MYWLTWGNQDGLRYGQENAYPSEDLPDWQKPIYFTQTVHIEKDEYFAKLGLASDKVHQQWDSFDHFFMNPPVNNGTSVDYMIQLEYPATIGMATIPGNSYECRRNTSRSSSP